MLYKRIIKVDIDGVGKTLSYPELKIEFSGEIDNDNEADSFEIIIYNLSQNTINNIKEGSDISLQAGYQDDFGTINIGVIDNVSTNVESSSKVTKILMTTATRSWTDDIISKTFNPPITSTQILQRIVPLSGLETGFIQLENEITYQRGKTVYGRVIDVVKMLAKETNTPITISNGKINFTNNQITKGYLISADSGMISSPSKIDEKNSDADYTVSILFNHNIKPKSLIKVQSTVLRGSFEVIRAKYNDDFTIDLDIKEV